MNVGGHHKFCMVLQIIEFISPYVLGSKLLFGSCVWGWVIKPNSGALYAHV